MTMQVDDLMRQAGLDAIADKDYRAAAGQEMTSPEQDRYHAAFYFACLVRNAARVQALEEARAECERLANDYRDRYKGRTDPIDRQALYNPHTDGCSDGAFECEDAIRLLGEDAGRGRNG